MTVDALRVQLALLPEYLSHHLVLTVVALTVGIAVCLPLGAWITRVRPLQWFVLTAAGVLQTIPGLALLALMVPLLGTIGSLELLLFLAGVVLLVLEIFLIPGFGVTGVAGIALIGVSLVLSRQDFLWPEFEWEWDIFRRNLYK